MKQQHMVCKAASATLLFAASLTMAAVSFGMMLKLVPASPVEESATRPAQTEDVQATQHHAVLAGQTPRQQEPLPGKPEQQHCNGHYYAVLNTADQPLLVEAMGPSALGPPMEVLGAGTSAFDWQLVQDPGLVQCLADSRHSYPQDQRPRPMQQLVLGEATHTVHRWVCGDQCNRSLAEVKR
ncbi:MAG: hypothetical protein Q4G66_10760 [bacterium]|nr:hypothetical protein [bacterium]